MSPHYMAHVKVDLSYNLVLLRALDSPDHRPPLTGGLRQANSVLFKASHHF